MAVFDQTEIRDRTSSIAKIPSVPTLINSLGIFSRELVSTSSIQFDVANDGNIYVLQDHLEGVQDKNTSEKSTYNVHTLPLSHWSISKTLTKQQLAGVRAFGTEAQEEQLSRAIVSELTKQSQHMDITREYLLADALINNKMTSNVHGEINFSTEFDSARQSVDLQYTNPGDVMAGIRTAMKAARDGLAGRGMTNGYTCLVSESFWNWLITSGDLQNSYEFGQGFPNGNPLTMEIPEVAGHSTFRWGNVDFLLYDQVFPGRTGSASPVLAEGSGILFPKVAGGSLGTWFAGPSARIDYQGGSAERYAWNYMGEKRKSVDVETEMSALPLITSPSAVVDLTFTP